MTSQTLTHYAPCDRDDDRAVCGHLMTAADHSMTQPTCPVCVAACDADAALEALIELEQLPLDADEAARELDPVLNAGVPEVAAPRQLTLDGADLFAYAVSLNRAYAAALPRRNA